MSNIIAGHFQLQDEIADARIALLRAGFAAERISAFYVNPAGQHDMYELGGDHDKSPGAKETDEGVVQGGATGAVAGAVAGSAAIPVAGGQQYRPLHAARQLMRARRGVLVHPRLGALHGGVAKTVEVDRDERVGLGGLGHRSAGGEPEVDVLRARCPHGVAACREHGDCMTRDRQCEVLFQQPRQRARVVRRRARDFLRAPVSGVDHDDGHGGRIPSSRVRCVRGNAVLQGCCPDLFGSF